MKNQAKISYVVPAYNAEKTLPQAIESILSQSISPYEIIVVNDGSKDGTSAAAKRYPQIKLIEKENGGESSALNCGIRQAAGDYIAIIESDVIIPSNWAEVLISDLDDSKTMGAGAVLETGNLENIIARLSGYDLDESYHKIKGKLVPHITSANSLFKRKIFGLVGHYDEKLLNSCLDAELNSRIIKKGFSLILNKKIKVKHFWKENLKQYLKRQFSYAYYRPLLNIGSLYPTDKTMKAQALIIGLMFISIVLWRLSFFYALAIIFFVLQMPKTIRIFLKEKDIAAFLLPFISFLKTLTGLIGYLFGLASKYAKKTL